LAAPTAGELPWDQTLIVLPDFLIGPLAPAIILLAFVSAGILYAFGGHDEQACRLTESGIGGCVALLIVHVLTTSSPDSILRQPKLRSFGGPT
jgi:type IV secretory pathway VirB2 component (pilin)